MDSYIEIYNVFGQMIEKIKINNNKIYLNKNLKDGLYFCVLKDNFNNILTNIKLIIKKP